MPTVKDSKLFKLLNRIIDNWDNITIRILQDGKWQSLRLSVINTDDPIIAWLRKCLDDLQNGGS